MSRKKTKKLRGWPLEGVYLLREAYRIGVVFVLFSVTRALFYLFNREFFPSMDTSHLGHLMLAGLRFDAAAIAFTNILYLLLAFLPFSFRYAKGYRRFLKVLFIASNGTALCLNCIDFEYFRFTFQRTNSRVFHEFQHEEHLGELIQQFFLDYWYLFLIGVALLATLSLLYGRDVHRQRPYGLREHMGVLLRGIIPLLLVAFLTIGGFRGGWMHSDRPITISNASAYTKTPLEVAIVLNTPFAIYKTIDNKAPSPITYFKTQEALEAIYSPIINPDTTRAEQRLNVVIIILESFASDAIGAYNATPNGEAYRGYTPFLDSIIPHSLAFQYGMANGHKSIDAMPAILASIPMMEEPFILSYYANNTINSLATELAPAGYHSAFFHGASKGSMGFDAFAQQAGIQEYYSRESYGNDREYDGIWGIWDEPFLQYFAQTMSNFPEPFLSTVFTLSSHHPFRVPSRYAGVFPTGSHPLHECIGYTDYALRKFFASAKSQPWYDRTIFVITADHTNYIDLPENQNDLGYYRIPIIFYRPGEELGGLQAKVAQQIDIMPTILGLLGHKKPYVAFGRDLLASEENPWAINYLSSSYQLVSGEWLIQYSDQPTALYNFHTDPRLQHNLLGEQVEVEERLEKLLQAIIQQYHTRMRENRLTVGKN